MQFVDVLDPPFSDIAYSIISCLVVPKNSTVTKYWHLVLGNLVIMPHCVVVDNCSHLATYGFTQMHP